MAPVPAPLPVPARRPRLIAWSLLGDEPLARKAAGGNQAAFAALYERYHGPLLAYCRTIVLNAEDARDAAQSALERALRALPERDTTRPLRPWLYRIAHNESVTILRRRRPEVELGPQIESVVPGPDVHAEQRGRLTQLVADLRTLPDRQRGALVMRELGGLDYDDIGGALGMSATAARRAVFEARTALHAVAEGRDAECTTVRRSLSDGDRRSLRARRIRAHLRFCSDCAIFQRSIRARRHDLAALAPWLPGAAAAGLLGLGVGTAGGGAVVAGGSATVAAGGGGLATAAGGLGWGGLPMTAKGLAVAAIVATGSTAAVKIEHGHDRPARPQAQAHSARVPKAPVGPAVAPAVTPLPATPHSRAVPRHGVTTRPRSSHRARTPRPVETLPVGRMEGRRPVISKPVIGALPTPVAQAPRQVAKAPDAPAPAASRPVRPSTQEIVRRQIEAAREQMRQAFVLARRSATGGGQSALLSARTTLDATLATIRSTLEDALAPFGVRLPAIAPTAAAPTGSEPAPTLSDLLAPASQLLGGLDALLRSLRATTP